MKPEIDHKAKIGPWLDNPVPAVFQGQDLTEYSSRMAKLQLAGCVFLGCPMGSELAAAAATAGCFIIPAVPKSAEVPFDPFTPGLYSPAELFDKFKTGGYAQCYDRIVYESYIDPVTKEEKPVDVDTLLLRRVHDWSIADALDEFLDAKARLKTVAIMGGHDVPRDKPIFATVATLGLELAKAGYIVLTGGGPGLMEAGNLGAYCAGFPDPQKALGTALARLKDAPTYDHKDWLAVAYDVWEKMGKPAEPAKSRNVGIPTWFYGHEPPNMFATDVAKYFENSVREEGLLARWCCSAGTTGRRRTRCCGTTRPTCGRRCTRWWRSLPPRRGSAATCSSPTARARSSSSSSPTRRPRGSRLDVPPEPQDRLAVER